MFFFSKCALNYKIWFLTNPTPWSDSNQPSVTQTKRKREHLQYITSLLDGLQWPPTIQTKTRPTLGVWAAWFMAAGGGKRNSTWPSNKTSALRWPPQRRQGRTTTSKGAGEGGCVSRWVGRNENIPRFDVKRVVLMVLGVVLCSLHFLLLFFVVFLVRFGSGRSIGKGEGQYFFTVLTDGLSGLRPTGADGSRESFQVNWHMPCLHASALNLAFTTHETESKAWTYLCDAWARATCLQSPSLPGPVQISGELQGDDGATTWLASRVCWLCTLKADRPPSRTSLNVI